MMEERGFLVARVEHWNHFAKIRQDLFGIGDLLAVSPQKEYSTTLIQTTTLSNMKSRIQKIKDSKVLPILKAAGWVVEVHGWRKLKKSGWVAKVHLC